ncbi:hypothetical protein NLG97_g10290 [Lecanicillium saksenae]|uniref:Uncharacterized protein n=1 Tax=Lecanicillium saksenae TaxID=468837 RepID=A0ACC1QFA9_9HYPO|nr:hypothetical protein NLG97_g10290 [Lecanicillium saksenae]
MWLAAIELRFRYLAWYQLREDMIHRGHGGVYYQPRASATRQLSNAAARENPDIPAHEIAEEVKLYVERGYGYAHIVEATSVDVLFDLDPAQFKLYERRKSKKQEDQFFSKLALDRANSAAAHPAQPDFIDKLARRAQDYQNFQRGRLVAWLDERMDGSAADAQNLEIHDPRGNKKRKTSSSGSSTASSASPLPPQSASMFQVQPWRISTVMRPWSEPFSAASAPMKRATRPYRPGYTKSLGETDGDRAVSSSASRSTPPPRPSTERTPAKNAPDIQIKPLQSDRQAGSSDKLPTAATSRQRSLPNIRDTIDDIYVLAARRQPNISRDPPVAAKPSFKIGSVEVLDFGAADEF